MILSERLFQEVNKKNEHGGKEIGQLSRDNWAYILLEALRIKHIKVNEINDHI